MVYLAVYHVIDHLYLILIEHGQVEMILMIQQKFLMYYQGVEHW